MNQTANYQLSQWEMEDRLLMQDFNGDNAKVDAALKAQADALAKETKERKAADAAQDQRIGLHQILTWSPPDSNQYELLVPLTSIAWEKYSTVHIFIDLHQPSYDPSNTENDQKYFGYLNKNNTAYTIAYHQKGLLHLILFPGGNRNAIVGGLVVGGEHHGPLRGKNLPFSQVKELHLYAHDSRCRFQSSSRVTVYAE